MSVFYAPETAMAKELRKWEYGPPQDGFRGYRDKVVTEFPKWLYRGGLTDDGVIGIIASALVHSAQEQARMEADGFLVDQEKAVLRVEHQQQEIAKLAAERHYHERHMSEPAQREVAAAEAATDAHLPVIPETPIRKRKGWPKGKPRKAKVEVIDARDS